MALWVDFIGIKCASLLRLLTTTIIKSFCILVFSKPVVKSILITSHFHLGMGSGYNNLGE